MKPIQLEHICKTFHLGDSRVKALDDVSLTVEKGEFAAVIGASGSGKSTLMNVVGCLDRADSGRYLLEGQSVGDMDRHRLADIRNQRIGFVFQGFNLLARTTALENVVLPLLYYRGHLTAAEAQQRAVEALHKVGLADRMHHEPNQLSGGQQQRVAIARALVNDPAIILADEPTGNLDSRTTLDVLTLFQELNDSGITMVLVTHEAEVAEHARRVVEMQDGRIRRDFEVNNRRRAGTVAIPGSSLS
ncbi:ABC transporter, ATP-binding protein [Syntrophotalea carbinolica DSM 2380]|uniref:ABC transporter, ATP-binding protein n=1 Tax=Syntrophotalea carbinolica (strain DSM 2380 / NBRC 103641 / GraBd1) TaxID=338963 RepID=Q3A7L8_SYNC1|nr:ABC transporter ATP-binding protein [Syntrophotalea carbinolica]ABA87626.1 ABC transporter, ATP-binding protein [Syntrophotalea carbinolica DSM 2380]